MTRKPRTHWTDGQTERLRALWPDHSASQIAKTLGPSFTRCAVIGRADRLGLPTKPREVRSRLLSEAVAHAWAEGRYEGRGA